MQYVSSRITALMSAKVTAYDIKVCLHLDISNKEERSRREDSYCLSPEVANHSCVVTIESIVYTGELLMSTTITKTASYWHPSNVKSAATV